MPQPKTIVITGCSSGFGRATALHMVKLGWQVFATVRKEADQESLLDEAARLGCKELLTPVLCDITREEDVAALKRVVSEAAPSLDALVNNAGSAFAAPVELIDLADLRAQLELNVVAQVGVTKALLPLLKTATGTIINISSISGRIATPVTGPYAASKFALEAISDALRAELAPFGVRVVLIEPGSSPTSIWATSKQRAEAKLNAHRDGPYGPLLNRFEKLISRVETDGFPPGLVAETVEKILTSPRPKARYVVPANQARIVMLRRFLPDRLWDRQVRKVLRW